ncbi:MAG TPA: hypothetical protein VLI55_20155 [Bryobacteraceae bacterium]|nr:hypothetical protein [Bryobacteraceae bacterium]
MKLAAVDTSPAKANLSTGIVYRIAGALVVSLVVILFFSLYVDRFAGLRSGDGSFQAGHAMLHGSIPYRSFNSGPPLDGVISGAVLWVFGERVSVMRAWGVAQHVLMGILLYCWLLRLFQPRHATLATLLAVIVSAGDPSNGIPSYGFEASSFFLLSGFLCLLASERGRSARLFIAYSASAGICAALSLGTKQSLGAGATVGIPLLAAIYIWHEGGARKAWIFLAGFAAGWMLIAGSVLLWLAKAGVVRQFLVDVFKKGPSAKAAHPSDFVVRAAHAAWGVRWGFFAACGVLAVCWAAFRRAGALEQPLAPRDEKPIHLVFIALLSTISISLGAAAAYAGKWPLKGFANFTVYISLLGTALLLAYYAFRLFRGKLSSREAQLAFVAGISFGIALMISLSWPASYDMAFPALAVTTAAILHGSTRWLRSLTYAAFALVLIAMTAEKLNCPHGFHEWTDQPVRLANTYSSQPMLKGILLPKATAELIDQAVAIAHEHVTRQDTIYIYPEFGILSTLIGRRGATSTGSHNIDVETDELARSEAKQLLAARPAVLIYYPTPEWSLRADERIWRSGKRSGQRDIIAAIEELARSYRLAASFRIPPNDSAIQIYVRP